MKYFKTVLYGKIEKQFSIHLWLVGLIIFSAALFFGILVIVKFAND